MKLLSLAVAATLVASTSAWAGSQVFTGSGGAVADSAGSPASTVFTVTIGDDAGTVDGIDFVSLVGFSHAYCGDLGAQLRHTAGGLTVSVDLFERIGYPSSGIYGDSSDFLGTYSFADSSFSSIWSAAAGVGATSPIPNGAYFASRDGGIRVNFKHAFDGMEAAGTWELVITDYQQDTSGQLGSWQLSVSTTVPAPGALSLMGALAWGGRRRARDRRSSSDPLR
ncbi:MAG: proprotein convertase P-domain-containing protein [Planctomycetota bacterium]|nr:proprotein convertase P-domain-containing protein [Planctomycetota bacterium]